MARIPVFRVAPSNAVGDCVEDVARSLFGVRDPKVTERGPHAQIQSDDVRIEADTARGGVWAADHGTLWDATGRPKLPAPDEAAQIADRTAAELRLLPQLRDPRFRFEREVSGTVAAFRSERGTEKRQLDIQEGKRLASYARSGMSIIDAWFRTAQEIQPSDNGAQAPDGPKVWAAAMYGTKAGATPGNDHLFGHGSVSGDPTSPTGFVGIWSPC